jgi:hypothetical protein
VAAKEEVGKDGMMDDWENVRLWDGLVALADNVGLIG